MWPVRELNPAKEINYKKKKQPSSLSRQDAKKVKQRHTLEPMKNK